MGIVRAHGVVAGVHWGSAPPRARLRWARLDCTPNHVPLTGLPPPRLPPLRKPAPLAHHAAPQPRPPQPSKGGADHESTLYCAAPTDGVLLFVVADRPNHFLCQHLGSALLAGLRPVVLGWDEDAWLERARKPWSYHLGAKLVLPLAYLRACKLPADTLVVFTDQDAVFQGGAAELRSSYQRASQLAAGAEIIFSMEREPYPGELKGFYPTGQSADGKGRKGYLNSGLWMGPAAAVEAMLTALTGAATDAQLRPLWQEYLDWGREPRRTPHVLFTENDQTRYSGLYLSQLHAVGCARREQRTKSVRGVSLARPAGAGLPWSCFVNWLRSKKNFVPRCDEHATRTCQHPLNPWRLGLDHRNLLFESLYHAGPHALSAGRMHPAGANYNRNHSTVVHLCGGAKVQFEREWNLPWDATAGRTPGSWLLELVRNRHRATTLATTVGRFAEDVTFLHPTLRRVDAGSTFGEMCGEAR